MTSREKAAETMPNENPEERTRDAYVGALLSNGHYNVLLTGDGCGYSHVGRTRLTGGAPDRVQSGGGFRLDLREMEPEGASLPVRLGAASEDGATRVRREGGAVAWRGLPFGIEARLEFAVAPTLDLELRRVTLTNRSGRARRFDLTSFLEIILHDPAAHASHPAFSRLFIQTEFAAEAGALLARRRPRTPEERHPWLVHALVGGRVDGHESDRGRFVGRGANPERPRALEPGERLSGTVGNVLDPMAGLRTVVDLPAGATRRVTYLLGAADDRPGALALVAGVTDDDAVEALFADAARARDARRERFGLSAADADRAERLALALLGGGGAAPRDIEGLARAGGRLEDLARFGLSPHRPCLIVDPLRPGPGAAPAPWSAIQAFWNEMGIGIDILHLGGDGAPPAIAPLRSLDRATLTPAERDRLLAAATSVVGSAWPNVVADVLPGSDLATRAAGADTTTPRPSDAASGWRAPAELRHFNGSGGFTPTGNEYVVRVRLTPDFTRRQLPPRPWTNVIANDTVGFLVSETGAGYTWSRNSREHRLTPWSNDQLLDPPGEAFYIRDDASRRYASVLPGPVPDGAELEMVHGFGYSRCRRSFEGIDLDTTLFVPVSDPLRITRITLTNRRDTMARLSLFGWYRLVLGGVPEVSGRFVVTENDAPNDTLLARNDFRGDYDGGTVFAAVAGRVDTQHVTGDRATFLGVGGGSAQPAALESVAPLDGRVGAGLDPAFAQQVVVTLAPGESREIAFLFGEAADDDAVRTLVAAYRAEDAVAEAERTAIDTWKRRIGGLRITTPSPELDLMLNGWLPYQTLACRIQARSAHYQSGGAYGFRDQLQDAMAFVYLEPDVARRQIVRNASHQFVEGDVLHWWHTPRSRGLRTRFADDLLWLPWLAAFYVRSTGDRALLDEMAPFLTAPLLEPGEDEVFLLPRDSGTSASIYEHGLRAIDRSLGVGAHGLPLFGVGDWNDGMSRVGREGRGESVWMAFFLMMVLDEFLPYCAERGDAERVERYTRHRAALRAAVNDAGWDGDWYRRGYYDDGAPLGSKESDECRIDALAQAWAVLSGAADAGRREQALDAAETHLISEQDGLIRLLTPPFENSKHDPGYIMGYVAGVRENGGQYTHAALWVVRALAEAGRNNRAAKLLAMLSPVHHAKTPEDVARYQVEPYVIAADVYGTAPHVGRGGWTWYTGSAAWMYRVGIESILGMTWHDGTMLRLEPSVPDDWPEFGITWRVPDVGGVSSFETTYEIHATNPDRRGRGVARCVVDGVAHAVADGVAHIPLLRDGAVHRVELVLGGAAS